MNNQINQNILWVEVSGFCTYLSMTETILPEPNLLPEKRAATEKVLAHSLNFIKCNIIFGVTAGSWQFILHVRQSKKFATEISGKVGHCAGLPAFKSYPLAMRICSKRQKTATCSRWVILIYHNHIYIYIYHWVLWWCVIWRKSE